MATLAVLLAAVCCCACQRATIVAQAAPSTAAAVSSPTAEVRATPPSTGLSPADSELQSVVSARIREDRKVEQQGFTVSIKDGIVELTGRVDNVLSRDRATRLAEAVRGVRAVDNRMEVVPEKREDADIESRSPEGVAVQRGNRENADPRRGAERRRAFDWHRELLARARAS